MLYENCVVQAYFEIRSNRVLIPLKIVVEKNENLQKEAVIGPLLLKKEFRVM